MTAVGDAAYPTPSELLQTILDAIVFYYTSQGLPAPNVGEGSDHYARAEAFSEQLSIAIANNQIAESAANPLTAVGTDLVELAAVFGVQPRPAAAATGFVTIGVTSGTVNLPANSLGSINGQLYKTTRTYNGAANGVQVALVALAVGAVGNQPANAKLTWSSAAIGNLVPQATVTMAGITNGLDADGDDQIRASLLEKLSSPPVGGNASSIKLWAEAASAGITAYVYPAARGAASYDVALTSAGGNRQVAAGVLALAKAAVLAKMPGQNDINMTTVTSQAVDVVLVIQAPLPQTAGGSGGGWDDAAPYPIEVTKVTAYNAGTGVATLSSTSSPSVGSSIGVWDPTYLDPTLGIPVGIMREYSVATVAGSAGAWLITVQSGWEASPLGQYVSAGALSLVSWAGTFRDGVAALGPGEKTVFLELLPRAARFPATDSGTAPPGLTSRLLDLVDTAYDEIGNIAYSVTYAAGTTAPQSAPTVPTTTAGPPGILTLNSIAFIKG